MEPKDRKKIDYMCNQLLQDIDMEKLWPKLLENNVYNRDDVNIPNWQNNMSNKDTVYDICSTIKTRGPRAFANLITSLKESDHHDIAQEIIKYQTFSDGNSCSRRSKNTDNEKNSPDASDDCTETPRSSPEPSNSNSDEKFEDDYHTKLTKNLETLSIKVRKAVKFKDIPDAKHIERYVMRSEPRGLVLIITNIKFIYYDDRDAAKYDEENLDKLFKEMGFKTKVLRNLTADEIRKEVRDFSKLKELRHVDSVFIIISSHGDGEHGKQKTEICGTDCVDSIQNDNYKPIFCTDIIDYFTAERCPKLQGKPKIFIFQTCRGKRHQKSYSRHVTDKGKKDDLNSEIPLKFSTRNYDDTLIAYATLPGHVSFRDEYNGSWFIQILCEVFMNYACEKHVLDLFVMTDRRLRDLRGPNNSCQTLWVLNQGFSHCYLNPGLFHKPSGINK